MTLVHVVAVIVGARFWGWLWSLPFRGRRASAGSALAGAIVAAFFGLLVSNAAGRPELGFWYLPALAGWLVVDVLRAGREPAQGRRRRRRARRG